MKNNEIMVSVQFDFPKEESYGDYSGIKDSLAFLVKSDITLKGFLEGLYYGLSNNFSNHFELYRKYLKTHNQIVVNYTRKGRFKIINCEKELKNTKITLSELGIVTSSVLIITMKNSISEKILFEEIPNSYILRSDDNSLEYNISSRTVEAVESSDIEILPPGESPQKEERSLADILIPSVLSTGGMVGVRMFMSSSSGMASTMWMMTAATGVMTLVTTTYNYFKQGSTEQKKKTEWKQNYEKYIKRIIDDKIGEWQKADVTYLKKLYPDMNELFTSLERLDSDIFERSQNDNDFMRISLGVSEHVKPLFTIKYEKKDEIFSDVYYRLCYESCQNGKEKRISGIYIDIPDKKIPWYAVRQKSRIRKENRKKKEMMRSGKMAKEMSLMSDLPYNFSTKYFRYLDGRTWGQAGVKAPYMLDIRNAGAVGVVSENNLYSHDFVKHVILDLAYYHSPEDIQFVFFFEDKLSIEEQEERIREYKFLPHCNELLESVSQFVFDQHSAGEVYGQLLNIMNQRDKEKKSDEENDSISEKLTQIICVIFEDYNIKSTGFSKYLPEAPKEGEEYKNNLGLTFLFCRDDKAKLPRYCGDVVKLDTGSSGEGYGYVKPRYSIMTRENILATSLTDNKRYPNFSNNYIFKGSDFKEQYELAFKRLSAIYYTRIAENGQVPNMVTLFNLYDIKSDDIIPVNPQALNPLTTTKVAENIWDSWNTLDDEHDVTKNLRVHIGANEHGNMSLDLYEKADGPHMLVAGTTGSGKSETIITYLIGLCMKFSPMDLNLMLVDMKGGGFSDRLGDLPHCVGVVTDTAGESEGISSAYMLKRFLDTLNAEIKKRKLLLQKFGVDTADAYIRARRIMVAIDELLRKEGISSIKELSPIFEELEKNNTNIEETNYSPNIKKIVELAGKLNEKQFNEYSENELKKIKSLSHLVLVVDEFTELKRFSSESNDVDFIAEITTIARVGRTLGFHIILVSQNIEGAITDDIRVNSKARICLKVATKQASKEMIDSPVAAAPTMPLNGRAYLLVGTGSRFEYFQSAYTGANQNLSIEDPINITYVPNSGRFNDKFYRSKEDNKIQKEAQKKVDPNATQLKFVVDTIIAINEGKPIPEQIFMPPLKTKLENTTEWRE